MKRYDLVVGIGCSFTEGGGLDSPNYHKYINGDINYYSEEFQHKQKSSEELAEWEHNKKQYTEYKKNNNYISYLAKLLECEYVNLAESNSSNEFIFEKIYKYFKENDLKNKKILLITQFSIFTRRRIFFNETNEFLNLNGVDIKHPPFYGDLKYKNIQKYYELYITSIHNDEIYIKNLIKDIDVYNEWLERKNIDTLWLSYEDEKNYLSNIKNFIKFDNLNLNEFTEKHRLRNLDLPNFPDNDKHFSIEGHTIISEKIYKYLKTDRYV